MVKLLGSAASDANDAIRKSELDAAIAGAASAWTVFEVDFGTVPVWGKTFTVNDGTVTSTSDIAVTMSSRVATGRIGNDAEWDGFTLSALAGTGSFDVSVIATPGPVVGKRNFQYQIG
jgi:hypothetical protein